jgi:glycosyltransferase involved in cell wall biosynthesis
VLHVIPTLTGGGAEKFLCALVTAFDASVVHTAIMPVYPTPVPLDERLARNVEIFAIDRRGRYDGGFFRRMVRGIRAFRPDIVHAHLHNGKYWGRISALAARVPIVIFTEHSPQGERRILPEVLVDEVLNRLTAGVITFTTRQCTMLEKHERIDRAKLRVIENGVPLPPAPEARRRIDARASLGIGEGEFAVLVLGRLEPVKNVQLAVRAMRELTPEARSGMRLYVIGDGSERSALERLAVSLGVAAHVVFLGHRADAVDLLYGGDALFLPSLVEGMPLAGLEALSVGLPVVSTPWPGAQELLGNGEFGAVLEDWNPQTAARALEHAAAHPQEFRELGERALRVARIRYDIRRTAREHERFYTELAQRKGIR